MEKKNKKKISDNKKYNLIDDFYNQLNQILSKNNQSKSSIKKAELKTILEIVFTNAAKQAIKGQRVRFPVLGILTMKKVPARKAGKQMNPFTKEMVSIPARPESRKPKWSFPKSLKELFANKRLWN